jgi:putative aminopeptidase FrvX
MNLLKQLCEIHAPSGEEYRIRDFIIDFVNRNSANWVQKPRLFYGDDYQDCLLIVFGEPSCAVMAHMDSVGFTAGYNNELIPIGSPAVNESSEIQDENGKTVAVYFDNIEKEWKLKKDETLTPGSTWTWRPGFRDADDIIASPFLDNRLGIYALLEIAPKLKNTILAFSTYEEMAKGGKAGFLARIMYLNFNIKKILVADITWVTPYVRAGEGVAISMRDVGIPRKKFRDYIVQLANESGVPYQLEIEKAGGSDGTIIGASDYPIDWIFIGAPEENPHGHIEKVHKKDIESMIQMYGYLCYRL